MVKFIEKDPYAPIQYSYEVSEILYHKKANSRISWSSKTLSSERCWC